VSGTQPDRPWERDEAAEAKAAEERKYNRWFLVVGGVIVGLVVLIGVMSSVGDDSSDTGEPSASSAVSGCQQFVERRLKAPSTADFTGMAAIPTGANGWRVDGSVDAENSFGAKVRTGFTCHMHSSGDRWVLEGISGL